MSTAEAGCGVAAACPPEHRRMPPVVTFSPELQALLRSQDGVVSRRQLAEHGFANAVIARRLRSGGWQCLLPDVFLVMSGAPSRRQLLVAALLWGGPESAVDGPDACSWYGLVVDRQPSPKVHIVVPFGSPARSMAFVRVRRTIGAIALGG